MNPSNPRYRWSKCLENPLLVRLRPRITLIRRICTDFNAVTNDEPVQALQRTTEGLRNRKVRKFFCEKAELEVGLGHLYRTRGARGKRGASVQLA